MSLCNFMDCCKSISNGMSPRSSSSYWIVFWKSVGSVMSVLSVFEPSPTCQSFFIFKSLSCSSFYYFSSSRSCFYSQDTISSTKFSLLSLKSKFLIFGVAITSRRSSFLNVYLIRSTLATGVALGEGMWRDGVDFSSCTASNLDWENMKLLFLTWSIKSAFLLFNSPVCTG